MPSIQVTGTLVDPITGPESNAEIKITSQLNYGQTTKYSGSQSSTDENGDYDFPLVYGRHLLAIKYDDSMVFRNLGTVSVSEELSSPIDINTLLLSASTDPDPELVNQLQILASQAALSAAEALASEQAAELSAAAFNKRFVQSTLDFINNGNDQTYAAGDRVQFNEDIPGSNSGGGVYIKTGNTGATSQTPMQLNSPDSFTDPNGDEYVFADNQLVLNRGQTPWFYGFGLEGDGAYQLIEGVWRNVTNGPINISYNAVTQDTVIKNGYSGSSINPEISENVTVEVQELAEWLILQ